jgi:GTP cyclohydrolase I
VGMLDYEVKWIAEVRGSATEFTASVAVPISTVCPCSKAISERGAHNQRGIATLAARAARPVSIGKLVAAVEGAASCELYSLLKRPDEKFVTERAYDNPVFVEDLVRTMAEVAQKWPGIRWYRAEAENFESIHSHNAYAMIEGP